ncbi:hypothetical protein O9H85_06065 [Paenibacillus filicis]|uniref:Uncharacterized protein n=1 Tax=Paenibacillus gyeongsangnamensis TaxID=3388067 RepID=A0ABT4Q580_9BACL|nr:hypothetical protein [Paenibacillus filicis]MCZ8511996.1 hypothetical protein [Paenibacillus filicis]
MSGMNEAQAAKWSRRRQMGKAKYVMYLGVAAWGFILTGLTTLSEWLTMGTYTPNWFFARLVVFSFIGFFVMNLRWENQERKFKERK